MAHPYGHALFVIMILSPKQRKNATVSMRCPSTGLVSDLFILQVSTELERKIPKGQDNAGKILLDTVPIQDINKKNLIIKTQYTISKQVILKQSVRYPDSVNWGTNSLIKVNHGL